MDFSNRTQPHQAHRPEANSAQPAAPAPSRVAEPGKTPRPKVKGGRDRWWRIGGTIFLFAVLILVIAALFVIGLYQPTSQKYVKADEYQAVFVNVNGTNGGQVYFGHIQNIADNYYRLDDVFYIQQASSTQKSQSSNLVLQKLGCQQIHDPEDQMIINKSQVLWWENLNNDGQVAKQISNFYKQNPTGQNCSTSTQKSSPTNTSGNNTQNTNNTDNSNTSNSNTTTGNKQ